MFGICHLNIIPLRKEKTSKSELVSQLLYGDLFTILKEEDNWYYVEILDDNYNGWINYSHNHTLVKMFRLALNSTAQSHESASLILQKDIDKLKSK